MCLYVCLSVCLRLLHDRKGLSLDFLVGLAREQRFGRHGLSPEDQVFLVLSDSVIKQLDGLKVCVCARVSQMCVCGGGSRPHLCVCEERPFGKCQAFFACVIVSMCVPVLAVCRRCQVYALVCVHSSVRVWRSVDLQDSTS